MRKVISEVWPVLTISIRDRKLITRKVVLIYEIENFYLPFRIIIPFHGKQKSIEILSPRLKKTVLKVANS